ncbi:hypothetical protein Hanom_Chr17g01584481 [Helianthus anomalus]
MVKDDEVDARFIQLQFGCTSAGSDHASVARLSRVKVFSTSGQTESARSAPESTRVN